MQGDGVDAFIRAICAAPEDDLPRLVFADFLDENGHEGWAEFIRLQVELYRKPCDAFMYSCHENGYKSCQCLNYGGRWKEAEDRCVELFKSDAVPKAVYVPAVNRNYKFVSLSLWRRGFPARTEYDHFSDTEWMDRGPEVVKLIPLEHVTLRDCRPNHETYYGWHSAQHTRFASAGVHNATLWPDLFDRLPEDEYKYDDPSLGRWWRTDWEANNALSTAALRLAHETRVVA